MGLKMKYSVQVKIFHETENKTMSNYVRAFDMSNDVTCSDFKTNIKNTLNTAYNLQVLKEVLYIGNKEIKDDEKVPLVSGIEYNLFLK